MNSTVDFDVYGPKSSVNDMKCWTTYTGDLFIVVKVCAEPATDFKWAYCRRIVYQYATD